MRLAVYFLLMAIGAVHICYYFPVLPERVYTHFIADGTPNGYMPPLGFARVYMGILFAMLMSFVVSGWLIRKFARFSGIPNRHYWLTPERKPQTVRSLIIACDVMGVITGLSIIALHHMLIQISLSPHPVMDTATVQFFVITYLGLFAAFVVWHFVHFRLPKDKA